MRLRAVSGFLVAILIFFAAPCAAQNIVTNGGFSSALQLGSWGNYGAGVPTYGTPAWDTSDSGGSASSGSVHLSLLGTAPAGTIVGVSQCIDISAEPLGGIYGFFASANGPASAQTSHSRAVVELSFFTDTGCSTPSSAAEGLGATAAAIPNTAAPWQTFPNAPVVNSNEGTATAPAGANGLQVRLYLEKTDANATAQQIFMDEVIVHRTGTTPVVLTNFGVE